jgi:hypothetical protein
MKKLSSLFESQEKKSNISYTAFVLSENEHWRLKEFLYKNSNLDEIVDGGGWSAIAHHSTINMGGFKHDRELLGTRFDLNVTTFCYDEMVCAVGVKWPQDLRFLSAPMPHITIAINKNAGGKPVMSNKLDWSTAETLPEFVINTTLLEVPQGETGFAGQF